MPWSDLGPSFAILGDMRDLLKDIDDAWFSDADTAAPAPRPAALEALGLEGSSLPAPGALTPMPLPAHTRLSTEEGNEFSRPNLAVGTVVDARVPKAPWFSDLRSLVPRRRPKPATLPPHVRAIQVRAEIATVAEEDVIAEVPVKRKSWWRRGHKS